MSEKIENIFSFLLTSSSSLALFSFSQLGVPNQETGCSHGLLGRFMGKCIWYSGNSLTNTPVQGGLHHLVCLHSWLTQLKALSINRYITCDCILYMAFSFLAIFSSLGYLQNHEAFLHLCFIPSTFSCLGEYGRSWWWMGKMGIHR